MKIKSATDDLFATSVFDTPLVDPSSALPQVAPRHCPQCSTGMLILERAARLSRFTPRQLYRWVEEGRLHFCELADGRVAICGQTLIARINELETETSQLAGQAVPMPGYAAITLTDHNGFTDLAADAPPRSSLVTAPRCNIGFSPRG